MMYFKKIDKTLDFFKIYPIYLRSFPLAERKPFYKIIRHSKIGNIDSFAIYDDNALVGLCINLLYKDIVLIDYLAIDKRYQNSGYGSKTLKYMQDHYKGQRIFLEIEDCDIANKQQELRLARKAFYIRNGFTPLPFKVIAFGVDMEMMAYACQVSYQEYIDIYRHIFKFDASKKIILKQ